MKYLGYFLIAWGVADFGLNLMEIDIWGEMGIPLPDMLWQYSAYIALAAGFGLLQLTKKSDDVEAVEQDA